MMPDEKAHQRVREPAPGDAMSTSAEAARRIIGRARETLRVLGITIRFNQLTVWRTPMAAFFTVIFPLLMFVLLASLIPGSVEIEGVMLSLAQFYAPAIGCFSIASSTYTNLGIGIAFQRDDGTLKRIRSTPVSATTFVVGQVVSSIVLAGFGFLMMILVGVLAMDVSFGAASQIPGAVVSFLLGSTTFAALGVALAALTPSATATPAIANITILPLAFVSNVFIPMDDPPTWLRVVGDVTPLKPFVSQMSNTTNPLLSGVSAWDWSNLGVMAAWLLAGALVGVRFFRWLPPVRKPR